MILSNVLKMQELEEEDLGYQSSGRVKKNRQGLAVGEAQNIFILCPIVAFYEKFDNFWFYFLFFGFSNLSKFFFVRLTLEGRSRVVDFAKFF